MFSQNFNRCGRTNEQREIALRLGRLQLCQPRSRRSYESEAALDATAFATALDHSSRQIPSAVPVRLPWQPNIDGLTREVGSAGPR